MSTGKHLERKWKEKRKVRTKNGTERPKGFPQATSFGTENVINLLEEKDWRGGGRGR